MKGLAAEVRRLAVEARGVLMEADRVEGDVDSLLDRIDRLRMALGERSHGPLRAWLESLRREVEASILPVETA